VTGGDGRVQGVAQRVRRSRLVLRKLCEGFEAGGKIGNSAIDSRVEHSVKKLTFTSIFEKVLAKNARGTSTSPK
jgi:hypothetical protein